MSEELRLGIHTCQKKTLYESIFNPIIPDLYTLQLFMGSPKTYNIYEPLEDDKNKIIKKLKEFERTFYFHAPYVALIARDVYDYRAINSRKCLQQMIDNTKDIPARIVFHAGSGTEENFVKNLDLIQQQKYSNKTLLLEVNAGSKKGESIGSNWDSIRKIFEKIDDEKKLGFCLDTAHIFAAGISKQDKFESVYKMFCEAEDFSNNSLLLVHLNDSKSKFKSNVDRHENLQKGYIWSNKSDGLISILEISANMNIDVILETPEPENDYNLICKLYPIKKSFHRNNIF